MEKAEVLTLIPRCLAGESEAREALVLAVQNRVFYHCKKMLRNEDDALDATQEILIAMLTKLDSLKEPAAFWGWLSAMTANYCRNVLRRGGREVQIPEDEEGNSLLDTFETLDAQTVPDKAMDSAESRRMIMELIDNLPEPQRLCVLMYYYDEMAVKDIAAALDTSEGTVKSRLNYARKAIKEGVDRYAAQGVKLYGLGGKGAAFAVAFQGIAGVAQVAFQAHGQGRGARHLHGACCVHGALHEVHRAGSGKGKARRIQREAVHGKVAVLGEEGKEESFKTVGGKQARHQRNIRRQYAEGRFHRASKQAPSQRQTIHRQQHDEDSNHRRRGGRLLRRNRNETALPKGRHHHL